MNRMLGLRRLSAVAAALALVVTACGDDGDDGEAAGTTATTAGSSETTEAAEPEPEPVSLRIVNTGQYDLTAIGPDAGTYLRTFEDAGIDLEVLYGQEVIETLASGDVDLGITSPNRLVGAISQGLEATILGPTTTGWVQYIIVRADSGVTLVDQFNGGKIGISRFGSAGHYSSVRVAEELGWPQSDYEFVPLGGLDNIVAALESGTIDAFMWSAEAAFSVEAEGTGVIIGNVADLVTDMPLNVLAVSNKALEENPEAIRRFCQAYYDAQSDFRSDPARAKEAFQSWGIESGVADQMIDSALQYVSTLSELNESALANIADATNRTIEEANVTAEDVAGMVKSCDDI